MRTLLIFCIFSCVSVSFAAESVQYEKSDPTKNVMDLVNSSIRRIDDLQALQTKAIVEMFSVQNKAIDEKLSMFMVNSKELALAEKSRVDAIRSVDVSASAIDRERAAAQDTALANQVTASAENLRALVASTAVAEANRLTIILADLTKRIADLERVQSLSVGSQTGAKDLWPVIASVVMVLIAIAAFIVPKLKAEPNGRRKEIES